MREMQSTVRPIVASSRFLGVHFLSFLFSVSGNETESGPVDSWVHTAFINFDVSGILT